MVSPVFVVVPAPPTSSLFPYTTLFRSLTVMVVTPVPESPEPSLVVVKWARTGRGHHWAPVTGTARMRTLVRAPAATSSAAQSRVWAVLSTTQPVAVVLAVSRGQPGPPG